MTEPTVDGRRFRVTIECDPMWGGEALEQMQASASLIVDGDLDLSADPVTGRAIIKFVTTDPRPFQRLQMLEQANGVVSVNPI